MAQASDAARTVIMTVDDDPGVSRAVARDLRRRYGQDHRIVRAESGRDALDALREVDEAFLTSTTRNVQAISAVDGRPLARVCGPTTQRLSDEFDALVAANPGDWQVPLAVANAYFNDDKFEDALKWADQSIKVKETFQNLRTKAMLLYYMGKKPEAFAVADQAVARGKADGQDTTRFEKQLADLKAGKM
jgi:hypothetical protein